MTRKIIFAFILLVFIPSQLFAWSGFVEKVIDGDTLHIRHINEKNTVKVRLYGIDAPEEQQAYGYNSTEFLRNLCEEKTVVVVDIDADQYGRTVAIVILKDRILQEELIQAGYAWVYPYFCKDKICDEWKAMQDKSVKSKIGLWNAPNPIPPWKWKKMR